MEKYDIRENEGGKQKVNKEIGTDDLEDDNHLQKKEEKVDEEET
jgi:hypothetical protein